MTLPELLKIHLFKDTSSPKDEIVIVLALFLRTEVDVKAFTFGGQKQIEVLSKILSKKSY